jgi:hypothetical protein
LLSAYLWYSADPNDQSFHRPTLVSLGGDSRGAELNPASAPHTTINKQKEFIASEAVAVAPVAD